MMSTNTHVRVVSAAGGTDASTTAVRPGSTFDRPEDSDV